ncbi:hypothetical protein C8Q79DRAFT_1012494 [Trametes meyenii]|nr:hypothetical protein C8Q79DRAFT_1012494 [Trametes meyenii]
MRVTFALKSRYYAAVQAVFGLGRANEHPHFDDFVAALVMMGFTPVAIDKRDVYCLEVPQDMGTGISGTVEVPVPEDICAWWSHEYARVADQLKKLLGWSEHTFIEIPEDYDTSDALYIPL